MLLFVSKVWLVVRCEACLNMNDKVSCRLADDAEIYLLLLKVHDDIVSTKISEASASRIDPVG